VHKKVLFLHSQANRDSRPNLIGGHSDLDKIYTLNGALYLAKTDWIQYNRSFFSPKTIGFGMPPELSVVIDTLLDWDQVELLIHRNTF
jgi:CMP-N-acetylneuraminic acid synthetase